MCSRRVRFGVPLTRASFPSSEGGELPNTVSLRFVTALFQKGIGFRDGTAQPRRDTLGMLPCIGTADLLIDTTHNNRARPWAAAPGGRAVGKVPPLTSFTRACVTLALTLGAGPVLMAQGNGLERAFAGALPESPDAILNRAADPDANGPVSQSPASQGGDRAGQDTHAAVPATRPNTEAEIEKRRWEGVIEPGERVPALTPRDKLLFPIHEELRPLSLVPVLVSASYGVAVNSDPKLGTGPQAWGERAGEAALRQTSIRVFSDGLLPILFHEDPRYRRMAYGSYTTRTEYAVRRLFVNQRNDAREGFNFSDVLGRGMAAALTEAYYPSRSQSSHVVFQTWGVSLAGSAGVNIFQEFWPDIKKKIFHARVP